MVTKSSNSQAGACEHCGSPVPAGAESARFCCRGCEAVFTLLQEQGLGAYYRFASGERAPVEEPPSRRSHLWLEGLLAKSGGPDEDGLRRLSLDVQGVHCTACVWLMNETFRRREGGLRITVNPTLGSVQLISGPAFDVEAWVNDVEAFGYQFGPPQKTMKAASTDLPLRLGVTAALGINVMLFSVSFYFGLAPNEPGLFSLFTWLSAALTTAAVVVGGGPFFATAWRGARHGVMHLDLPIAVGIALVYVTSLVQAFRGRGDLTYFDTLNTFITLMLVGRWLQERVLERNRRYLLDDDGADGLLIRKVTGTQVQVQPAAKVRAGDVLLIAPGELVPVEAQLVDGPANLSSEWMTGESRGREVAMGASVAAGSFNAGARAFHVVATQPFADSALTRLLRQADGGERGVDPVTASGWALFSRRWVLKVLVLAAVGFAWWLPRGLDGATRVAAAVLVVTCPCAIGLAVPLAYELAQSRLRRRGFFIRRDDLLDRLVRVRTVVFDKTGTLTLGRLEVADAGAWQALGEVEQAVAFNLAVRSAHPVSAAVARALEPFRPRYEALAEVREVPGAGLEWSRPDGVWRLGRAAWACHGSNSPSVLSRNGTEVLGFSVREALRGDARAEIAWLAERGLSVWLLSGDAPGRVAEVAEALGVDTAHAKGALSPQGKAEWVERLGADGALYLGDGVNDALAFERALAAGTPAADRPVIPAKSDFFLVGGGLSGLRDALETAQHLRRVVKRLLAISLTYNVFAVGASLAGVMSPLAAAVAMPASTLSLLALTAWSFRRRGFERLAQNVQSAEAWS